MTDTNDTTTALLRALAAWVDEALARATPEGRQVAAAALQRPDTDLAVLAQLGRGTVVLLACQPGHEPIEVGRALLPQLQQHEGVPVAAPGTLQ